MNAIIGTFSFTLFVSIFHIDAVNARLRCGQQYCDGEGEFCCDDECCISVWNVWWFWLFWISMLLCFGSCCWRCCRSYRNRDQMGEYIIVRPTDRPGTTMYGAVPVNNPYGVVTVTVAPTAPVTPHATMAPAPPAYYNEKPPPYAPIPSK